MDLLTFLDRGLLGLPTWQVALAALALTHVTIAAVTIFLHRSQTHRAVDLHPAVMHFFRFWLWMTTGMVTREWVAVHRKHHAKVETAEDPHSPVFFGLGRMLLGGTELYMQACRDPDLISRYGRGTPDDWLERTLYSRVEWLGCTLMLFIDVALFGASGLVVWAVQMAWIPFSAAGVINGVGHTHGYRNFDSPDASTNIVPWGILIGGEELHNNHHTYPTSAKLSLRWFEFDLSWGYIRALEILGLARVLHRAPVARMASVPSAAVDLHTLQNLIRMRYDLLARYAGEMRRALEEEISHLRLAGKDAGRFSGLRRWLGADPGAIPDVQRQNLQDLLHQSKAMRTLVEMRDELAGIWQQSAATREQMLAQLQDWIARAEASGNRALEDMAVRIRCYAPA